MVRFRPQLPSLILSYSASAGAIGLAKMGRWSRMQLVLRTECLQRSGVTSRMNNLARCRQVYGAIESAEHGPIAWSRSRPSYMPALSMSATNLMSARRAPTPE